MDPDDYIINEIFNDINVLNLVKNNNTRGIWYLKFDDSREKYKIYLLELAEISHIGFPIDVVNKFVKLINEYDININRLVVSNLNNIFDVITIKI